MILELLKHSTLLSKKTLFVNILFFMYLRSYIHIHILKKVINIFTFQIIDTIGDSD